MLLKGRGERDQFTLMGVVCVGKMRVHVGGWRGEGGGRAVAIRSEGCSGK
jgi:hypothetical protein